MLETVAIELSHEGLNNRTYFVQESANTHFSHVSTAIRAVSAKMPLSATFLTGSFYNPISTKFLNFCRRVKNQPSTG